MKNGNYSIEPTGDLSTFPALGEPAAIANLINLRREREKTGNTMIFPGSVVLSADKKDITFKLKTEIEVRCCAFGFLPFWKDAGVASKKLFGCGQRMISSISKPRQLSVTSSLFVSLNHLFAHI